MKNYITIIAIFLLTWTVNAQYNNIVPVENFYNYVQNNNITQGTYLKDVNNVLNKYVGTWKGEYDGKQYTIQAYKTTQITTSGKMKEDLIKIRYMIKDGNGNTIRETIEDTGAKALIGKLFTKENPNVYSLLYYAENDQEVECGDVGTMFIETLANNTKLKLYVQPKSMLFAKIEGEPDPCPNGRILPPFPDKDNPMILNKVINPMNQNR